MSAGQRRDAARNRQAIIDAFLELLSSEGAEVPMYRVAQRAGVGQATLYRHFPERALLAMAVYERRLDDLTHVAEKHKGDSQAFLQLLRALIEQDAKTPGLLRVLREGPDSERYLRPLTERALHLLAQPLADAQAAGVIRADLELRDILILFAMLEGIAQTADVAGKPPVRLRAFELLVHGFTRHPNE